MALDHYPKIGIVYLSFHCEPYIDDVVASLRHLTYPKDKIEFIIVDNPHPKHGSSARYLEEHVMPLSGKEIPHTTLLAQTKNLGFTGGNNVGVSWALEHGCDYIFFYNQDGSLATNGLEPLIEAMEADKKIGLAQSLMLLDPETDLVNSAGNAFHYLGFGYTNYSRLPVKDLKLPAVSEINYASGAAVMVRSELVRRHGAWDEDFFLYHEDLEWSLRLRSQGYKVVLARESIFYHKYSFGRTKDKYYWMERNRYGTMLMYFRWPTLLLLLPMGLVLEVAIFFLAWRGGWLDKRLEIYKYWLKSSNWRRWLKKRKKIQKSRKVSDRKLLEQAVSGIHFQEKKMDSPVLDIIGNPLMSLYYGVIVRGLIWW